MTHIDNMPHILQHGITHISSPNANPGYRPIGDGSLIGSRAAFPVIAGKTLGDYIPFYFWGHMPMLYVIQNGHNGVTRVAPSDIVYLVCTIGRLVALAQPSLFTNGHAISQLSVTYDIKEVARIEEIVDFAAVKEPFWIKEGDQDLKRRKEAEFLVEGDIPLVAIAGYIVYDETASKSLLALNVPTDKIFIRKDFYF